MLIPASNTGSEIAPLIAARLRTGLVAHTAEITADKDGMLHMLVPAFGGKLMADNTIPEARPLMISVKPGVFDKTEVAPVDNAERVDLDVAEFASKERKIKLIERSVTEADEVPVEKADVVVCAGLGSALSGNLDKVKEFASKIGASVGYTRPLSDLGYYPDESQMVGTSGKTIKPKVYIGFGNSGAGQHVCGIKDSGIIININNDEEAQCFDVSDYKVVSDCGKILDALVAIATER